MQRYTLLFEFIFHVRVHCVCFLHSSSAEGGLYSWGKGDKYIRILLRPALSQEGPASSGLTPGQGLLWGGLFSGHH